MTSRPEGGISTLEYHVLLALAGGPLYGYAVKEAVEEESSGALTPRAGSLYRVIARLMTWHLLEDAEPDEAAPPHPGRERKYYALTAEGRETLAAEAARLKEAAALAEERLGAVRGRP